MESRNLFSLSALLKEVAGDSSPPPSPREKRPPPQGHVEFKVNERAARVAMWVNQSFLLGDDEIAPEENGTLSTLVFVCLRNRPNVITVLISFGLLINTTIYRNSI